MNIQTVEILNSVLLLSGIPIIIILWVCAIKMVSDLIIGEEDEK